MPKLNVSTSPDAIAKVFELCGSEWSVSITPSQFSETFTRNTLRPNTGWNAVAFTYRDEETDEVIACTIVEKHKGYYKSIDKSSLVTSIVSAPVDQLSIGVNSITMLHVGYVFTSKNHRKQGLAELLIKEAIEYTEKGIVEEELAKSNPNKKDNFKSMVTSIDHRGEVVVDEKLVNYYLSKKYVWYLYSAVATFYNRFGFKGVPVELYQVPLEPKPEYGVLLEKLLEDQVVGGKKLRFLHRSNIQDKALIEFIYQTRELELLTELNSNTSHVELSNTTRKSQSSLTNLSEILAMSKQQPLPENAVDDTDSSDKMRKSSVVESSVPKFGIKPDYNLFEMNTDIAIDHGKFAGLSDEENYFSGVQGAVLSNALQNKSYYIIWSGMMGKKLFILGMGELKNDLFQSSVVGGRRSSSFSGLNEMGGYNFQDLDILFYAAGYAAKRKSLPYNNNVYVCKNDLPSNIPPEVLHDYFLSHLKQQYEAPVEFVTDVAKKHEILPMVRRFGNSSNEFNLDWVSNSMILWG